LDRKGIIIFSAGLLMGFAVTGLVARKKPIGTLRIDESDPNEEPYIFLELNQDVGSVRTKKRVMLTVLDKNYLPAK